MKKNVKIFQINGFRGLILTFFIVSCLIAGFIAFPAFIAMQVWNHVSVKMGSLITINFIEGLLLWGILALSIFIFNKRKFIVCFSAKQELNETELKDVISKFKSQKNDAPILFSKDFTVKCDSKEETENKEYLQEITTEEKD